MINFDLWLSFNLATKKKPKGSINSDIERFIESTITAPTKFFLENFPEHF